MTDASQYRPHDLVWTSEKVERLWSYYAASPSHRSQYFSAHSGAWIVAAADRVVGLSGKRVLDFGCGRGDLLRHLFDRGFDASGLEFAQSAADETCTRFAIERHFRGLELVTTLPSKLATESFDIVFLVEVVEHLLDDQIAPTLAETRRLLAPGGVVIVTTVNDEDLGAANVRCPDCGATFHQWQHQRRFTKKTLADQFESLGFKTIHSEGLLWGRSSRAELRWRLLHPRRRLSRPHLLYIGAR